MDEEEGGEEGEGDGHLVDGEEAGGEAHTPHMGAHPADLQVAPALETQGPLLHQALTDKYLTLRELIFSS